MSALLRSVILNLIQLKHDSDLVALEHPLLGLG